MIRVGLVVLFGHHLGSASVNNCLAANRGVGFVVLLPWSEEEGWVGGAKKVEEVGGGEERRGLRIPLLLPLPLSVLPLLLLPLPLLLMGLMLLLLLLLLR